MPTLENPKSLDLGAGEVEKYINKEDIKTYAKDNYDLTRSAKKIYSQVLGNRCTVHTHKILDLNIRWRCLV